MNPRQERGLAIAQTRTIKRLDDGFAVQSQNSKRFYFVDKEGQCACPDCQKGLSDKCKHAFAVEYYLQKITTTKEGKTVIETKRLTYPQAWHAYDKSQQEEKARFLELLNDLIGLPVSQTKRSRGQPKISEHDLLFSSALKVYSQFSLRRFMSDLQEAKSKGFIHKKACFASVGHFMQKEELTPVLKDLIEKSAGVLKSVETQFAIDSTGFTTNKFSDYCREKHDTKKAHKWLKLHALIGCKTNIICTCAVLSEKSADSPQLEPLINTASNIFDLKEVSADKAYSSRENLEIIQNAGAQPFIPFKNNARALAKGTPIWHKMFHYFKFNQEEFAKHYHARSNVESTFGALKAKFNDSLKSKTNTAQVNELLLKVLCFNIVQVIHETNELGITANF
ncbi:MAG TPA: transposase [archaeon]|nr:transposase [archaeon]